MSRMRWMTLFVGLVIAASAVACGGSGDSGGDDAAGASFAADADVEEGAGNGGNAERSAMQIPSVGPSVIKTADMSIEVPHDGFQDAFQAVVDLARAKGGFVLSSETRGDDSRTGTITLRVPAETFEATVGRIGDLGRVTDKTVAGEDVSQEFVDLHARIRNLVAQETVMLRLMERANSIAATIRVQNQLTPIQIEIERLRGRLRYLEDQTALSTITVFMTEAGVGAAGEPGTPERAWDIARKTTSAIASGFLLGAAALTPVAVVLIAIFLFARWIWPRLARMTGS